MNKKRASPGKTPERLKINTDWESAMGDALKKPAPPGGWPKPAPMPQRAPKSKKKKP